MNSRSGPGNPRQAALALHAMGDTDREWMLAQLAASQRAILAPLLAELHALGIPRQADLLRRLAMPERTNPVDAASVARALSHEPRRLVAHLLQHDWVGRAALQEALGVERREQRLAGCADLPEAPALRRALLAEMQRLQLAPTQVAVRRPKPWHRLLLRMLGRGAA